MRTKLENNEIEQVKYLYENTLYTIQQLANKFNTSWNTMSGIIHTNNFQKPKELKHQIFVNRNKQRWENLTPEQRSENARKGHLKKQGEYKKSIYSKVSKGVQNAYRNKPQSEKLRLAEEHSKKVKEYWKNVDEKIHQEFINKQKSVWTPEKRRAHGLKISNTYSKQTETEKQRRRNVTSIKSKEMWRNFTEQDKLKRNKHLSQSISNVWANRDEQEKSIIYSRIFSTLTKNQTFGKSKMEEQLNEKFKSSGLEYSWQYRISNYWFDFNIISNNSNTLLELNGKYWHYNRPYTNCEEDEIIYNNLKNSNVSQYQNIAKKWKYIDTKKLNYCKSKNLNLIVVYYDSINQIDDIYNFIIANLNTGIKLLVL